MVEILKGILGANSIQDVYLLGFVDIEDGIANFSADMRYIYLEVGEHYIELESIHQYSRLSIKVVNSIKYKFEIDEDMIPSKTSISQIVLTDSLSSKNNVKSLIFYNIDSASNQIFCDSLQINLNNGQEIFFDPSFYFGINIGGSEQKKFWFENLSNDIKLNETIIEVL